MAFGLENLSDGQRKALLIGVPAVALVAIGVRFGKGGSSAATPPPATDATATTATPPTGYIPTGSTDAIGVGQLADFESKLTDLFASVKNQPVPTANPASTPTLASLGLGGTPVYLAAPSGTYLWYGDGAFWRDRPVTAQEIAYIKALGSPPGIRSVSDATIQQIMALETMHRY